MGLCGMRWHALHHVWKVGGMKIVTSFRKWRSIRKRYRKGPKCERNRQIGWVQGRLHMVMFPSPSQLPFLQNFGDVQFHDHILTEAIVEGSRARLEAPRFLSCSAFWVAFRIITDKLVIIHNWIGTWFKCESEIRILFIPQSDALSPQKLSQNHCFGWLFLKKKCQRTDDKIEHKKALVDPSTWKGW